MTENDAIELIKNRIFTATGIVGIGSNGKAFTDLETAIKALEEIQQYRAIGTLEECRKAMEKQIPQKPSNESLDGLNYFSICPSCNQGLDEDERESFCECGQRLDWSVVATLLTFIVNVAWTFALVHMTGVNL